MRTGYITGWGAIALTSISIFILACGPLPVGGEQASTGSGGPQTTGTATGQATTSAGTSSGSTSTSDAPAPTTSATTAVTATEEWSTLWEPIADLGEVDSDGFIPRLDQGAPNCDLWNDECPEGQKCAGAGWGWASCIPLAPAPGALGEPCTKETCGRGLSCDHGVCLEICGLAREGGLSCPQGALCPHPEAAWPPLCHANCDPLASDCYEGQICMLDVAPNLVFRCGPDISGASGELFDDCTASSKCDPGLFCVMQADVAVECAANSDGCCLPFCDVSLPNTCPGLGQTCVSFFANPPPQYADVGLCTLP